MRPGPDRRRNGLITMCFRKVFFIALAAAAGFALCNDVAGAKAKEFARGLELRPSLLDRFPAQPLISIAARDRAAPATPASASSIAQIVGGNDAAVRHLEARGFRNVTGLVRRGDNFVAQAKDQNGIKVRVVINARTGEIVGLSRIMKKR
jgi:hypothetical protein